MLEVRRKNEHAQQALQALFGSRESPQEVATMNKPLNRRDFERLTLAALGGLAAGCQEQPKPAPVAKAEDGKADDINPMLDEPHVCRGLNTCKGHGSNSCAGRSDCASKEIAHSCGSQNACKGQGGCGQNPGENACKGQGGCHVPLMDEIWDQARKRFEELMAKAGKEVGPAPAKKSS